MRKLVLFTVIVLLLAFLYWALFPLIVSKGGNLAKDLAGALRGYTPTFAAILTIICTTKQKGLKKYWRSIFRFKASALAYSVVFLIPLLINLLVVVITLLITDIQWSFAELNIPKFLAIYLIFIFLDGPLGEELGWRGYFLPTLLSKFSPFISSMIIGLVMFFWHMLLFAADGPELNFDFVVKYLVSILGIAVIFTFVYLRFSKIPWIAVLLHTSVNYFIFFRNSLIPELRNISADNVAYVVIVVFVATGCLVLLKRE